MLATALGHRAAQGTEVRRRAGAGAAVGAGHAVDAPARRALRRLRLRPDAGARRPAPARVRSRVRALRPRRLAGAARDDRRDRRRRVLATHGHAEPLARYLREQGLDAGVIRTAWEGEPRVTDRLAGLRAEMNRVSPAPLRRHRPHDVDQRQGRRDGRVLRLGAARRRGLGGLLPHRPAAEAAAALLVHRQLDARRDRPAAMDARRVLRGRRRRRGDGGARPGPAAVGPVGRPAACRDGSRSASCPSRAWIRPHSSSA